MTGVGVCGIFIPDRVQASPSGVYLPVYVDVQKWEVTFSFHFHGELYIVVDPIEVFQEIH